MSLRTDFEVFQNVKAKHEVNLRDEFTLGRIYICIDIENACRSTQIHSESDSENVNANYGKFIQIQQEPSENAFVNPSISRSHPSKSKIN